MSAVGWALPAKIIELQHRATTAKWWAVPTLPDSDAHQTRHHRRGGPRLGRRGFWFSRPARLYWSCPKPTGASLEPRRVRPGHTFFLHSQARHLISPKSAGLVGSPSHRRVQSAE